MKEETVVSIASLFNYSFIVICKTISVYVNVCFCMCL